MMIRYPFAPMYDDVGKKVIKVKGNLNCVVKDETVTLDENNCAETQVMFRGNKVSFKISDSDKKYPFTFFTSSDMIITNLEWL
jgi:adenylosuccinate synthase